MRFDVTLAPDMGATLRFLGYGAGPARVDAATAGKLEASAAELVRAVTPRWVWRRYGLHRPACGGPGLSPAPGPLAGDESALALFDGGPPLPGGDIAHHLDGCDGVVALVLTLGQGPERLIRAAEAADMARAVLLDALASTLAEQYADEAEGRLRRHFEGEGLYLTGRFSPGYGDLPLTLQKNLIALTGAEKEIGLTVNQNGLMLPRKSISALLGVAGHPVTGHLAGCKGCALDGKCKLQKEGRPCGKNKP